MSLLRRRKGSEPGKGPSHSSEPKVLSEEETEDDKNKKKKKKKNNKWSCFDSCCWGVGCICTLWWFLLFLYQMMPSSIPQYVTEAFTGPMPDPPGLKLKKEGLKVKHPVVFVPGIVTGGLELWEGHLCAEGLFRKRLWGGTFGEVYKRYQLPTILLVLVFVCCLNFDLMLMFA